MCSLLSDYLHRRWAMQMLHNVYTPTPQPPNPPTLPPCLSMCIMSTPTLDTLWWQLNFICTCGLFSLSVYFPMLYFIIWTLMMILYPCVEANMILFDQQRERSRCQRQLVFAKEMLISKRAMQTTCLVIKFDSWISKVGKLQKVVHRVYE